MSNPSGIRIGVALFFSVALHAVLMGMDFGGEIAVVSPSPQRKVEIRLIKRQAPPVVKKEVVSPEEITKPEPPKKSLPESVPLAKPVMVVVKEIPPVSLPSAPVVPEPEPETGLDPTEAVDRGDQVVKEVAAEQAELPAIRLARPLYRENPPPEYPGRARRRQWEGTVLLEVSVSREGRVEELVVAESSGHKILDKAALQAVESWLFEPGRRGDEIIAMRVMVPVRFDLR